DGPRRVFVESAIIRACPPRSVGIGSDRMIGPGASVIGAQIDHDAFVAAVVSIFPAAHLGARAIVRTNAVVHINSELPAGRVVPEGWTAVGRPAEVVPPGRDERMLVSLYCMNCTKP